MTCRELAEFILQYLDDELPAYVRHEFLRHLRLCESCREYIASYQAAVEMGRRAYRDAESDAAAAGTPEELIAAVLAATTRRKEQ